ncbi:AMP-binding protein [Urechidicola vernalis]|uniref:AMP-binding protein n=1 Tax=Urechidicola vernalis TaxID=3075600 RepID=A0ABU2Y2T7_9FLAO|nr:AMP-binding protein [Urechidicola sp. P050]MDT0552519.1 AMP-binding protein [Urechidicola sp. P050]
MQFQPHPSFKITFLSISVKKEVEQFLESFLDDSKVIQLQTSGSTGVPKLIEIEKRYMLNSAKATGSFFGLGENTTALLCMNPSYIGGKMMLVRAIILGWKLDVMEPSINPLKVLDKSYDFSAMVPLQVQNSITELHKVKKLIIGGGVVSHQLAKQLENVSTECFATYGMTETVSHIAIKKINHRVEASKSEFLLLPGIKVSVDHRDCLRIEAPEITSEIVATNDIVTITSDNSFEWLGRFDNVINSGGVKLHPERIENKLEQFIEQPFFVTGISDSVLGQKLILIIEGEINENAILSEVKTITALSKYEVPKEVYTVPNFIKTETKKIQRKKTLDLLKL